MQPIKKMKLLAAPLLFLCGVQACLDTHRWCAEWARLGECSRYPDYMRINCKASCGVCTCADLNSSCAYWAQSGECDKTSKALRQYMKNNCAKSCGLCGGASTHGTEGGSVPDTDSCASVRAIPSSVRSDFSIPSLHSKYTEAYGIPIVSSSNVPDRALTRACYLTRFLFADRRDVRAGYLKWKGYMGVVGKNEGVLSLPEYAFLRNDRKTDWNARARGFGATKSVPISTVGEENLLCYGYPSDRYYEQDIGMHEFAHGLHLLGATTAIPNFEQRLQGLFNAARTRGLWSNTYAAQDYKEYWAEGVSNYFSVNRCSRRGKPDGIQNHVCTRASLKSYDPNLYSLIREIFPCDNQVIDRCDSGGQSRITTQRLKTKVNGKCVGM